MHSNTLPNGRGPKPQNKNHMNGHVKHGHKKSSAVLPMMTSYRAPEIQGYQHSKRVGSYMIGELLGEGSFAKVREGLHLIVGEKVAIKIIDKRAARMDFYIHKHLRREAGILQQLDHPNIVSLLEVLETDNNLYMVLELCNGGPLLDLIWAQQGLSEGEAKRFTRQVISAVQHLHNMGIMHRDLKVENLLLDEDQNIKLIDFGLSSYHIPTCEVLPTGPIQSASSIYDRNMTATLCGSPAYAAPEIISQKNYGPKVDVWSMWAGRHHALARSADIFVVPKTMGITIRGVNTFAMLTATLPFLVEPFNIRLLLRKMLTGEMSELPGNISTECRDFVSCLLQADPSCRPSIHQASRHPWLGNTTTAPSPAASRHSLTEIDHDIIYEIRVRVGIDTCHVIESLLGRRVDEFGALYALMLSRKQRQWRKDMSVVRSSFDKMKMDLDEEDAVEASVRAIIDYTTTMEADRRSYRDSQTSLGLNQGDKEVKEERAQTFHQIYRDVLYEDEENTDILASDSQKKLRMEARKISEMCQRSNATSAASGNPWVGLMGREKSFLGECAVYKPEIVESFKVSEKRKGRRVRKVERGAVRTKGNPVKGQKSVTTKQPHYAPMGHVAPVYGHGKGPDIQLSALGYTKTITKQSKQKTVPSDVHNSGDSIRWNGLKSKSKTSIVDKSTLLVKRTSTNRNGSNYDLNGRPCKSNEFAMATSPKKAKQKASKKGKVNKKVEDAISRLYGTSRRKSLAIFQSRSKDKGQDKTDDVNIHENQNEGVPKITPKNDVINDGKLTKRAKTNKTLPRKKGRRKSTIQRRESQSLAKGDPTDGKLMTALPNVES